jgi:hypothetical protein
VGRKGEKMGVERKTRIVEMVVGSAFTSVLGCTME